MPTKGKQAEGQRRGGDIGDRQKMGYPTPATLVTSSWRKTLPTTQFSRPGALRLVPSLPEAARPPARGLRSGPWPWH